MTLFDFLQGKEPKWIQVSQDNFSSKDSFTKPDAKNALIEVLNHCGFDECYIKLELLNFNDSMEEYIDSLLKDLKIHREELKDLKKAKADIEEIDSLKISIRDYTGEIEEYKQNWKPFLIEYINEKFKEQEKAGKKKTTKKKR